MRRKGQGGRKRSISCQTLKNQVWNTISFYEISRNPLMLSWGRMSFPLTFNRNSVSIEKFQEEYGWHAYIKYDLPKNPGDKRTSHQMLTGASDRCCESGEKITWRKIGEKPSYRKDRSKCTSWGPEIVQCYIQNVCGNLLFILQNSSHTCTVVFASSSYTCKELNMIIISDQFFQVIWLK